MCVSRMLMTTTMMVMSPLSRGTIQNVKRIRFVHRSNGSTANRNDGGVWRPRKPRVVILGSGWGGNRLARELDKNIFDVSVVSPANHFLFTPLLPQTTVGTLEFRTVQEPIRTIENLSGYFQAKARHLDVDARSVTCEEIFRGETFQLPWDFLVIATGCKTNTFNTPGVMENEGKDVFFLKHLHHARQIRKRVLECFERAAIPQTSDAERDRLLHFVVVGGGPTSCEFVAELHDFVAQDIRRWYPDLCDKVKITLVEAGPRILGNFDQSLVDCASIETFVSLSIYLSLSLSSDSDSFISATTSAQMRTGISKKEKSTSRRTSVSPQ